MELKQNTELPPLDQDIPVSTAKDKKPFPVKQIFIALFALIAITYGIGVYYYNSHFPRNVYVNNKKLGNLTLSSAEELFTGDIDAHDISLVEKDRTEILKASDTKAVISVGSQISDLQASYSPWTWFLNFFGRQDYSIKLDVTFDEEALEDTVDQLQCFDQKNIIGPENSYIEYKDDTYQIVPEVLGNTVKKKELIGQIQEALSLCTTEINLEKADLYKLPTIYSTDEAMNTALTKVNKYISSVITYDFSYTTETVNKDLIHDWINISDDFKVTLKKDAIKDYLYELAKTYNTMGASRDFTTANGNEIHVYDGDYGFKIDHDSELKKLIKNIKSGKETTREPEYSYRGMCRNSERDDIGGSYVEVSISQQEVWLFIDGKCIMNTSCVTGDPSKQRTYTGVYGITYKTSPATLTGSNSNGTSYSSKVTFWMPFNGNEGLHDASWRSSFGGSIYKGNGSHGCVNLPYYAAATIYKYVDEGFPVVIHD